MSARFFVTVVGVIAVTLLPAGPAAAELGTLDALIMPGKVIKGHEKLEEDCKQCHVPFRKSEQMELCMECHDHANIAEDIRTKRGYHGRLKEKTCNKCHTEHKGRNMNIVQLNKKSFDHRLTDFPLSGGHAKPQVKCEDCHRPGAKYHRAPSQCYACHKKDDKHKGKLGKACVNCHVDRNWKEIRFDHSKTDYPLEGKHLLAKCEACHVNNKFKATPKRCISCHRKDDNKKGHKGRFGSKCKTCHTAEDWSVSIFNHNRHTKYPLRGKHIRVECGACHRGILYQEKLGTACIACHKKDDEHKGNFGRKCETCHSERSWRTITFNHARDTKYPLRGKHKQIACTDCHKGYLYRKQKLSTMCYACHKKDDVHKGQEGTKCARCHNESSWKKKDTLFDHDLTRFPLLGKHARVKCKQCHRAQTFKDADIECVSCHKKDDEHKRRLGVFCEQCHNAASWKRWDFDHDSKTSFSLDGGHRGLNCLACHKHPAKKTPSLSGSCFSCHEVDDVHDGSYGRACEQCHVTSSFKKLKRGMRLLQ